MILEIATSLLILGGIGFVIFSAIRNALDEVDRKQLDPAEVLRSAAVAIGMYLAMLAIAVGFIDLFQAIAGSDRIAGSSSDLARSLSLLIVSTPVFALLLRFVERQRRAQDRIGLGWSIHLVASLTTTLIGVLVSAGQIIDDIEGPGIQSDEVAQLLGWLLVWAAYWFVLRPRLGVLGAVHLLAGTAAGLGWLAAGTIGAGTAVLSDAYDAVFEEVLARSIPTTSWLLVAAVGLVVWSWHWWHLNSARGVEGDTRQGRSWFVMVVALAIVPAVIALLVVLYLSITGVLIWFLGTTDQTAAEFFDPAPALTTVGLVALAAWAYHRWQLVREGQPQRNESLRFHDYAVTAVGLVTSITGVALVVALVFDSLTARRAIAETFETDNRMIGTVTALALGAALWWRMWGQIEQHRAEDPVAECSSLWRKLYLIIAAGLGGLLLAVSLIWVLFVTLRDLFDGVFGNETLSELADPIGWGVAVVAGAWYHYGVWRSDRAVLAAVASEPSASPVGPPTDAEPSAVQPPPPGVRAVEADVPPVEAAAAPLHFRWGNEADHGELFSLQRAAFVDEALVYGTPDIPALRESFAGFEQRTAEVETLVLVDGVRIIGAVGLREHNGLPWLERLMIAPDRRGEHLGSQVVRRIEDHARELGHEATRVVVGDRDPELVDFYESLGYRTIGRTAATDSTPSLLVMEHTLTELGNQSDGGPHIG